MHLTTVRQTVNWLSKSHPQSHSENREKKDFTNSLLSTTHGHSGQWEVRGNLLRDFWERYFLCLTCRRRKAWPCFLLSAFECGNRYLVTKRLTKTFTRTLGITKTPRYWQCPLTPRLLVNDVHQLKDIILLRYQYYLKWSISSMQFGSKSNVAFLRNRITHHRIYMGCQSTPKSQNNLEE